MSSFFEGFSGLASEDEGQVSVADGRPVDIRFDCCILFWEHGLKDLYRKFINMSFVVLCAVLSQGACNRGTLIRSFYTRMQALTGTRAYTYFKDL